jgi:hypothetical protein
MEFYENLKNSYIDPSKDFKSYWIETRNIDENCKKPTENAGKLLLYFSDDKYYKNWKKIWFATVLGFLGYKSKVRTAKPNPKYSGKSKPILVYFYDFNDKKNIKRIKKELKSLGIKQKPRIKLNRDTLREMENN